MIRLLPIAILVSLFSIACQEGAAPEQQAAAAASEERAATEKERNYTTIGVDDFMAMQADFEGILLDVRTPEEIKGGMIPGAVHIDINDPQFEDKIRTLDMSREIVAYCKVGGRSARASERLRLLDFPEVYNMMGGFDDWKAKGGEVLLPDGSAAD